MKEKEKTQRLIEGSIEVVKNDKGFIDLYLNTSRYGRLKVILADYKQPRRVAINRKLKYRMYCEGK